MKPTDTLGASKEHYIGCANEYKAAAYYMFNGGQVYWPSVQQTNVDFVVELKGKLKKVQVKTATWTKSGNHSYLQCRTRLRNKYQDAKPSDMYDILFIIYRNRYWEIPASKIDSSNLSLCTTNFKTKKQNKWHSYEVTLD